jgi:hypothetical protein
MEAMFFNGMTAQMLATAESGGCSRMNKIAYRLDEYIQVLSPHDRIALDSGSKSVEGRVARGVITDAQCIWMRRCSRAIDPPMQRFTHLMSECDAIPLVDDKRVPRQVDARSISDTGGDGHRVATSA